MLYQATTNTENNNNRDRFVQAIETAVNKMTPPAAGNITVKKQSVGVSVVDVPGNFSSNKTTENR